MEEFFLRCKVARHTFSLMEVMVTIVLVGVIATVSAFSLWPFYHSYRFRLEVENLYELMQELQLEAMTFQSDMAIRFTKENGRMIARSKSDETVLTSRTIDLSQVEKQSDTTDIILYSNGLLAMPRTLQFSHKNVHCWIDFRGGHLIKFYETPPPKEESGIASENLDLNEIKKNLTINPHET